MYQKAGFRVQAPDNSAGTGTVGAAGAAGICVEANPAFARMLGAAPETLAGRPWLDFTTAGDRERCVAAGMDDYVTKPIRVEALVEALLGAHKRKE